MLRNKEIIEQLTLEEKAGLCDGLDYWHLKAVERHALPSIMICDGPHGLRKQNPNKSKDAGFMKSVPAVCFPLACVTACSWDPGLLYEMGQALGDKCLAEKVSVILGPGVNIKRSPLCGRNFEYFSEDPLLAGEIGAALINGIQSKGVGTSMKHFAANNQETRRMTVSSVVDERALREIYLTAFETAVKKAKPWTIMNAYNRLNGTYCSENEYLQTDILRKEWGFDGVVVSDWGAANNRVDGVKAGNDLEMPSSFGMNSVKIVDAVRSGELSEDVLDERVDKLIDLILKGKENLQGYYHIDEEAQHQLARKVAGQSMVLLKNDEKILPIAKGKRIAVIGEMAVSPRYQGAGSSKINPTKMDCALDCLLDEGYDVIYAKGYDKKTDKVDQKLMYEAVSAAASVDVAILFVGLTEDFEAEGFDRSSMNMPENHNELVKAVAAANPNTVVVLSGGAPVSMPWLDGAKAVLNSYLSGQAGAAAVADILSGRVNPSGKLAETYAVCNSSTPCRNFFPGHPAAVEYRESIYVGYRYYEKAQKKVRFPFGFGLSYTAFEYSDLKLDKSSMNDSEELTVSFTVKNTGDVDGAEIAQVYVADKESTIFRPVKELKGFRKVFLKAGEEKAISVTLDKRAFAYYNINIADWHVETGEFDILVGASSEDIRLSGTVMVESTAPDAIVPDYRESAPDYYTADITEVDKAQFEQVLGFGLPDYDAISGTLGYTNNLEDAASGKWGGRINRGVNFMIRHISSGQSAEFAKAIALQTPVKNFVSMSAGLFDEKMADGLLLVLNDDDPLKGAGKIVGGIPRMIVNLPGFLKKI
ncbi:MAG: glycoside hydrolase family 3 C-terminal domain-containing protein [Oscillospiraceae bacterium]|nr:glycoside hydrolase family 3 C-terminal domain-containing protein [Oscillospiraceae bacterium]